MKPQTRWQKMQKSKKIIKLSFGVILFTFFIFWGIFESFSKKDNTPELKSYPDELSTPLTNKLSTFHSTLEADQEIEDLMSKWHIAGASVALAKDGKLLYAKGYGYADKEDSIRVQPYHKFRIASVSKLITAIAILKLQEDKKLDLEDKVFGQDGILNDSIYSYIDPRVEQITVWHLLTHTAGWTHRWGDHMFMPLTIAEKMNTPAPADLSTIIQFALSKKLHFTPGAYSSYSNLGYAILGEVIEKIAGLTYESYVKEHVLYPIGIFDMQMGKNLQEQRAENEVIYYEGDQPEKVKSCYGTGEIVPRYYGGNDIETLGAAGGWIATSVDLMKLVMAIDGEDDIPDILSKESLELMTHPQKGSAIGWTGTDWKTHWWRTGYFAGSNAAIVYNDRFCWVVLMNSSTWKGPKFSKYINQTMKKAISHVEKWPDQDLFKYHYYKPILQVQND